MKRYTLSINGGIGKHICATTLIRFIKEQEPESKINVLSGYPEVFMNNPHVDRNLHHMTSYVFDDYIKGSDYRSGDPYSMLEYYEQKKHMSSIYPLAYRFEKENKDIYPEIYLSEEEKRMAGDLVAKSKRPIITFQATGGNQCMHQHKDPRQMTARDLLQHSAQKIVDICLREGFNVIQIALPHEYKLRDVMSFNNLPFRRYMALIPHIKAHIGIDSAMMHAIAAFKKPSLILWGCTNVGNLGYPYMTNIHRKECLSPMCARPHVGMPDLVPEGGWVCPHDLVCQKWNYEELEDQIGAFLNKLKENVPMEEQNDNKKDITRIPLNCPTCKAGSK